MNRLPAGGIAVAGPSGSGKSSMFFGGEHVKGCVLADTGSQGHALFWRHPEEDIFYIDNSPQNTKGRNERGGGFPIDPAQQVMNAVRDFERRGIVWVLDSFTTVVEHQCVYVKGLANANKRGDTQLSQYDYKGIVGRMRDLALVLSQSHGFTLFNTAPGGQTKLPDGSMRDTPKGSIVALPALSGTENGETILARWTSVWVVCPGGSWKNAAGEPVTVPRGLFVPNRDFRKEGTSLYTPIKDPLGIIQESGTGEFGSENWQGDRVHKIGPPIGQRGHGKPAIDGFMEAMYSRFRHRMDPKPKSGTTAPVTTSPPPPPVDNTPADPEMFSRILKLADAYCASANVNGDEYLKGKEKEAGFNRLAGEAMSKGTAAKLMASINADIGKLAANPPKAEKTEAKEGPPPPKDGAEFMERLETFGAKYLPERSLPHSALVAHIVKKGTEAGYPFEFAEWQGEQLVKGMEWAKEHELETRPADSKKSGKKKDAA